MSAKVDHVLAAPDPGGHTCHWPGCTARVKPAMWGCKLHWFKLPLTLRNRIWHAYRAGQEVDKRPSAAYLAASRDAQSWIGQHEGRALL